MPFTQETLSLKAALDETTDDIRWIVKVDPPDSENFVFLLFTEAYRREVGVGHYELAGKTPHEAMPIQDALSVCGHYASCIRARQPISYSEFLNIGGRWRWWRTQLTPRFDDNGRIHRLIGVSTLIEPIEAGLRTALKQNQLQVHYQPIAAITPELFSCLDCHDYHACIDKAGIFVGYEALIRWIGSEYGPDQFLPIAKEAGLMESITRLVLFDAVKRLKRLPEHRWISINISDCDFSEDLARAISRYEVSRCRLSFEITEDSRLDPPTIARIANARILGHPIKIDDYGTRSANLSWLQILDVDGIKIDRRFISGVAHDTNKQAIVQSAIAVAKNLDKPLDVIAEGVETIEELRWLAAAGCDAVQGYLIGKPEPMDANEYSDRIP